MAWETSVIIGNEEYPVRFDRAEAPTEEELQTIANDIISSKQGTSEQGLAGAMGSQAAQGYYSALMTGGVKGIGGLAELIPGAQEAGRAFRELGTEMEGQTREMFPVDPTQAERFPVKAAGAVGQAAGLAAQTAATAGLGLPSQAIRGTTLLSAGLQGAGTGAEMADTYGITDPYARAAMTLGYGGAEAGFEAVGGIGGKEFSNALSGAIADYTGSAIKRFAKTALVEGLEEVPTGQTQDFLLQAFAPEDDARPGFSTTGAPLPPSFFTKENLSNRLEEFALGGVAGGVFGGVEALSNDSSLRQGMRLRESARARIQELETIPEPTEEQAVELETLREQDRTLSDQLDGRGVPSLVQDRLLEEAVPSQPLLSPEEQAEIAPPSPEVEETLAQADAVEQASSPLTAEVLREEADALYQEENTPVEEPVESAVAEQALEEGAVDLASMSQEEYADYLAENGTPEGVSMYDALTARPDQRGFTAAQRVEAYQQNKDASKAFTQRMVDLWEALRRTPIVGILARGADSGWTNFEVGQDTHQAGTDRYKSYATLRDPLALSQEQVVGFLEALRDAGYNGQVKFPGMGTRALLGFDNVVMHGASQQDATLGEQVARQFFGGDLTATQFGVDRGGKSHSESLAEQAEAKRKANEGAKSNAPTGTGTTADASQAEVSQPSPQGTQPTGGAQVAAQARPVNLSQQKGGEVMVDPGLPVPVGEPIPSRALEDFARSQISDPSKAEYFITNILPSIQAQSGLFRSVTPMALDWGSGLRVSFFTNGLLVDPNRLVNSIPENATPQQAQSVVSALMDEEFRHAVSLELESRSPEFARDLTDAWDSLPENIKTLSSKIYGRPFNSAIEARHEFFRQYWQNVEVQNLTEAAIRQNTTLMQKFQKLLDSFIAALKKLQSGAIPEVKPILDRLIAQAEQRANEIRSASKTETKPSAPQTFAPGLSQEQRTEFVKTIGEAARSVPEQSRWGDDKVFISDLYKEWSKSHPGSTFEDFKEMLTEARGEVQLGRLDLVESLNPEQRQKMNESMISFMGSEWSLLRIPAQKVTPSAETVTESAPPVKKPILREVPEGLTFPKIPTQQPSTKPTGPPKAPVQEETPPEPETTSLKRAVVDAERASRGAETIPTPQRRGWSQADLEAEAELKANPKAGEELLAKLQANPRALSDTENSLLLFYKVDVRNAIDNASKAVNQATSETDKADAQAILDQLLNEYNNIDIFSRLAGAEAGRSLNARKMEKDLLKRDISLASLLQQYRNAKGEPLTEAERKEVEKNAESLQKAQEKVDKAKSDKEAQKSKPVERQLAKDTLKQVREERASVKGGVKKRIADKSKGAREWLKENPEEQGLSAPEGLSAPSAINPRMEALATVGAEYIENGAASLTKYTDELVKEFGESVRPQAQTLFERSQEIREETKKELADEEEAIKNSADPVKVLEAGRKRLEDQPSDKVNKKLVADLYRSYIRSKPSMKPEDIVASVTKDIQGIYPNATESDVRVALTDYGKAKWPSRDALKAREAEDLRIIRLIESIERTKRGDKPLKSGLQRSKPTARERELTKELKDLMRENKVETTSEAQLTSSRKAIVNRLKNQIEELTRIIEGKAKPAKDRQTVEYDQEINDLIKERDSLKSYVDDLTGPSPSGKWNQQAQRAARASAEYYRRRIQQNDLRRKVSPSFEATEETEKLKQEAADAKAEFDTLRDASGITQEEQLASQKASLEKKVAELEKQIQTGENPPQGKKRANFSELEPLKQQLKGLRSTIKLLEGKTPEATRAKAAAKAIQKSIDELQRRIAQKDTTPKAKRTPVDNEELRALRQERDFLKEVYDGVREAENPTRLPEEIALDNLKRRIEKKRYEAENQISQQEYLELPAENPLFQDRINAALYEQEQVRKAWNNEVLARKLAGRSGIKKVLGAGQETLNLARAILTSFDLSAVLRQGSVIALANPARAARAIVPMLKSFASDQARFEAMEALKKRKNYPLYSKAGLYLADINETDLNAMEEAFMSRWVNKIPKALGGGFVRGSQRAYTTFLNQLRADSFDAMFESLGGTGKVTKEEGKSIANFINVATGRGIIGSSAKPQGNPALATIFFSPRLVASRFNLLAGQPLYGGTARTRKLVAIEYAKYLAGVAVAVGLAALMKDDEDETPVLETDPRSSDFLKVRYGNTRLDLFGGLLQATILMSRLISGSTKSLDGEVKPIRGEDKGFSDAGAGDIIWRFIRSKLSPAIGSMVNLVEGEDFAGQPTDLKNEAKKMVIPMSFGSIADAMEEQGIPRGTVLSILSIFGAGLQTYEPK
jgi:hypothetical protein